MFDMSELPKIAPDFFSKPGPLPRLSGPVRFLIDGGSKGEQPDLLRACFARLDFRHQVDPLDGVPFHVDLSLHVLPGLHMAMGKMHGVHNWRTREMRSNSPEDFVLAINLGGRYAVTQGKNDIVLEEGEATLVSCFEPCGYAHHPPGDVIAMRLSRALLAPLVSSIESCYLRRIPRDTPALRLLTNYVRNARDREVVANGELRRLMVAHVYDLAAITIGATRDASAAAEAGGLRAARLLAIKQDIAGQLHSPALSVAALAERHCCTPRVIQRLFESEGTTFTQYVLAQRLERAFRMLSDPRRKGEKISAVALDCGFGDLSYFNRVFRRSFAAAPSDIRAQAHRN
jgi:AraC-like DNA-binding protein